AGKLRASAERRIYRRRSGSAAFDTGNGERSGKVLSRVYLQLHAGPGADARFAGFADAAASDWRHLGHGDSSATGSGRKEFAGGGGAFYTRADGHEVPVFGERP